MESTAINMISHFSITAFMVMFSLFGLSDYGGNTRPDSLDTIQFKHNNKLNLSEDGRVALHKLLKSKSFSYTRLGAGRKFSSEYKNFAILMQESNSIEALKKLVIEGNDIAKAYGLIGLRIKKPVLIVEYKSLILKSSQSIKINGGCLSSNENISKLLYSNKTSGRLNLNYEWLENDLKHRYQWIEKNHKFFKDINT